MYWLSGVSLLFKLPTQGNLNGNLAPILGRIATNCGWAFELSADDYERRDKC